MIEAEKVQYRGMKIVRSDDILAGPEAKLIGGALGVRHGWVREALVVDASLFDDERWHPSWGRVSARAYNAPVGGLTANYGAFAVRVVPGASAGDHRLSRRPSWNSQGA